MVVYFPLFNHFHFMKCPHCSEEVKEIRFEKIPRVIGETVSVPLKNSVIASCPKCDKVISIVCGGSIDSD